MSRFYRKTQGIFFLCLAWAHHQHRLKRRKRYTLKASANKSFRPQNKDRSFIDIVPFLKGLGLDLKDLRNQRKAGYSSKPMKLDINVAELRSKRRFLI